MHSFLIYSQHFGSDFNPYPPVGLKGYERNCLINELRRSFEHLEFDFGPNDLLTFLDRRKILYHWEFIRTYTDSLLSGWGTKYTVRDMIVLHVYSENDAFEARLHTNARPLSDGWRERFETVGVGEQDYVN